MTSNEQLAFSIDTSDFDAVAAEDEYQPAFSVRAAEARAYARAAMAAESHRILEQARACVRARQVERQAEIERVRAATRSGARRTTLAAVILVAAVLGSGVWAGLHYVDAPAPVAGVAL
jgi:hypothetical protein